MSPKAKRLSLFKNYPELESISFSIGYQSRTLLRVVKLNQLGFFHANKTTKLTPEQKGNLVENNIKLTTLSSFPETLVAENYLNLSDLNSFRQTYRMNHSAQVVFLKSGEVKIQMSDSLYPTSLHDFFR